MFFLILGFLGVIFIVLVRWIFYPVIETSEANKKHSISNDSLINSNNEFDIIFILF